MRHAARPALHDETGKGEQAMTAEEHAMKPVALEDKYTADSGRVYVSGSQALTRLPMMQRQRDLAAGLNTAGFISGYRGSPLGVYDIALWQAQRFLEQHHIHFRPGVNEDLAATAVWGSQQVNALGGALYDGVFAMWYGKGPGVDRSGDPLKHGNYAGSSAHGGVLVLCGDDHGARSSTVAHQSDQALVHFGMPVLFPATIQEYLDLGLYGFALSRYAGCWVGFKCVTDVVEGSASVAVDPQRVDIRLPAEHALPAGGLNLKLGMFPLAAEAQMLARLDAARAFVRANRLDREIWPQPRKRLGIVSSGKAWLDTMDALAQLGIDEAGAHELGVSVYKVAMVWPLEPQGILDFARGCEQLLVIEEKRPLIEEQLAAILYNQPADMRPRLSGKRDANGAPLLPAGGELNPGLLAGIIAAQLLALGADAALQTRCAALQQALLQPGAGAPGALVRMPSFCAGCPHNTSTRVPEGSVAMGGIGCHGLAVWLPERNTQTLYHMGGEGAAWIGQAPFMERRHIFQNLGDGTYFHSGLLAIRANVAAGSNITYKILLNGAISMTGGQPIEGESFDGGITAPHVAQQLHAEGVRHIALVSEDLGRHRERSNYPSITTFHHRDELDALQREIREHPGVSAIIYEQSCATERKRLRKRGKYPDVARRYLISEEVCEGCGDCGVQSNCIALEPQPTALGRKRQINQSVCNKDFSCAKGMCPSFVTVYGGALRGATAQQQGGMEESLFADLPEAVPLADARSCNILVAGIGGSGIITLGALLGIAAHMEGKPVSVLDITGLAQRNGPVTSHVRFVAGSELQLATRIPEGAADLVLAADLVVAAGADVLARMSAVRSAVVYNAHVAPTNAFARNPDLDFDSAAMEGALAARTRPDGVLGSNATRIAIELLGNAIGANLFLLGAAWQRGFIPLARASLERAIELNGTAVAMNLRAFALGRLSVVHPQRLEALLAREQPVRIVEAETLDGLVAQRVALLTDYQNAAYAQRYTRLVQRVAETERRRTGSTGRLSETVARVYASLLACKDEYEVGRLLSGERLRQQLAATFEGEYRIAFNLAPPLLARRDALSGRYRKIELGAWMLPLLGLLARLKFLRGTPFDVFGYSAHRRRERALVAQYEQLLETLLAGLDNGNHALAAELAALPEKVRGFDVVKEAAMDAMNARREQLLTRFSATVAAEPAA
jgi:indolepyruvate ferredoxin oxidoreductase